jgi:hypothetical protein
MDDALAANTRLQRLALRELPGPGNLLGVLSVWLGGRVLLMQI